MKLQDIMIRDVVQAAPDEPSSPIGEAAKNGSEMIDARGLG